uniref:RING-type domain-containing protein n=1 Tax=Oryza meridionalis TaxID=40149 RepID=A0A0E0F9K4_9ORYZ
MEADDDVSTAALTDGGVGQRHRFTFLLPSQNDDEDAMMPPPPPTSTDDEDDDFSVDDVAQILSHLLLNGIISGETALLLQILTVALHFDLSGGGGGGGGGHGENNDEDAMMAAPPPSIDDEDDDDGSPLLDQVLCYLLLNGIISSERALQILQNANMPLDLDLHLDDGGANMPLDLDDGGGGFRGVPASAAAVAGLEKQVFHQFDHHGDDDEEEAKDSAAGCVICMEEFVAGDEVCAIPCASFHHHCIAEWLGRSNVCPLCRHALPVEEQDEGFVDGGGAT